MNNSELVIRVVNIIIKILFYTFFYMVALYFSGFLLDGKLPNIGNKIYLSVGCAIICTFIPFFDVMKTFINNYLKIGSK